jgi:hypothetical protein
VISSSQRPLPDNTQHSQQKNIHASAGFEPTFSTGEGSQAYAFDRVAIGIGSIEVTLQKFGTLIEIRIFYKSVVK